MLFLFFIFWQITLYCGGHPLGSTVVSLHSSLMSDQNLQLPAVIEALFPLVSPDQERFDDSAEVPEVGVSVVLKLEEMSAAPAQQPTQLGNVESSDGHQVSHREL